MATLPFSLRSIKSTDLQLQRSIVSQKRDDLNKNYSVMSIKGLFRFTEEKERRDDDDCLMKDQIRKRGVRRFLNVKGTKQCRWVDKEIERRRPR